MFYDAKDPDAAYAPIAPLRPPEGAPNVLIVMLDDVGFGASSAFGGPCEMPTAERLAAKGLKYTRFHTRALCSPTRAALLSGRNHHTVGMGGITEIATSAPGYSSLRPNTCQPLAEILRLNGYGTAHIGKCHEVPVWESSPAGPFDRWPSPGNGFEHFYGFIGGETNQYYPALHDGTKAVNPPATPEQGYHLMEDLADRGIAWIRQQQALTPDKPFFMYFAPGATHTPHHVPREWADKYQGRFDDGWDALRERTFARQQGARGDRRRQRVDRSSRRDPLMGGDGRRAQAGARPPDGELRRLFGVRRPPRRAVDRRARSAGDPRRHARLLHHRRQRRLGRGDDQRDAERDDRPQRRQRSGVGRVCARPR